MKKMGRISKVLTFLLAFILVASLLDFVPAAAADNEFKAVYTVKQLKKAMKAKSASSIVFRTETYNDITIPYVKAAKNKTIYIDAPHANITNKSKFKSVNIRSIASYTEAVSGNTITWHSSYEEKIIVAEGKTVKKLTIGNWYGGDDYGYVLRQGAKIKSLAMVSYTGRKSKTDKKKNTVTIEYYGEYDDEDSYEAVYELDKYGRIVNKTTTTIGDDAGKVMKYSYKYDKNGNYIEIACTEPEYAYTSTTYEYDANNNLIKRELKNDHEIIYLNKYEYDTEGNLTRMEFGSYGEKPSVRELKYDKKSRCIEDKEEGGDYTYLATYKYDSAGRLTKETFSRPGYNYSTEYKYDKNGMLIEETETPASYTIHYSRDYLGNCIFTTTNHVTEDGFLYDMGHVTLENSYLGDTQRYEDGFVSPVHDGSFDKEEYEKAGYTVVETVEEFINAIAPGAKIMIAPGYYNMSEFIENHSSYVTEHVVIDYNWADGHELVIVDCDDLVISGGATSSYVTELVIDATHSAVLKFEHCSNIKLNSLTLGHTEQGSCYGNVVQLYQCSNVGLYNMDLFGCGVYGIGANTICSDIRLYNSIIRDCSGGIFEFENIDGPVTFTNCLFFDSEDGGSYWSASDKPLQITFKKCYFGEKESEYLRSRDDLIIEDCLWCEVTAEPED